MKTAGILVVWLLFCLAGSYILAASTGYTAEEIWRMRGSAHGSLPFFGMAFFGFFVGAFVLFMVNSFRRK